MTDAVQLLTLPEVAERLRLSRRTVDKLVAAGELRVVRFGRSVRVTDDDAPVFVGRRSGERLTGYVASQHWPRLLAERNLRPMRAHDLRHGWASLALAAGVPMRVIADQLGHASPALTANVYAHLGNDALSDASSAVDDLLRREG